MERFFSSIKLLVSFKNVGSRDIRFCGSLADFFSRLFLVFFAVFFLSFFEGVSNTLFFDFWLLLGSQNGSQMRPESCQNRCKKWIEKLPVSGSDFSVIFRGFGTHFYVKK